MFHINFEIDLPLVLLGITVKKIPPTSHISSLLRCLFMFNLKSKAKKPVMLKIPFLRDIQGKSNLLFEEEKRPWPQEKQEISIPTLV